MKTALSALFLMLFSFVFFRTPLKADDKSSVYKTITVSNNNRPKNDDEVNQQESITVERVKFLSVTVVACLLLIVIALLMGNIKRTAATNLQLQELNNEITRQRDNVDRINHHLEEIIDDRTKDLQVKNKKLSEYSSYLSHQIRGPIATLKGLMNLEKENLIGKEECIDMMAKCVSEIDEKVIEMSAMLHANKKTDNI